MPYINVTKGWERHFGHLLKIGGQVSTLRENSMKSAYCDDTRFIRPSIVALTGEFAFM
jgi:hypothetical protein